MTYEDLLERMNETYKEKAGFIPHEATAEGIKLRVLAGELYEMLNNLNWVKEQAFVTTASDDYVKRHADDRGIQKKEAVKSVGVLAFSRNEASAHNVDIPIGTMCAVAGEPDAQFVTTRAGSIRAGNLKEYLYAESVNGGKKYNAAANTINTLISAPEGVSAVTNETEFVGGSDEESAESFRKRVISAISEIPNGVNLSYYRSLAESIEGIHMANAIASNDDPTQVTVYIWGKETVPTQEAASMLVLELAKYRPINTTVVVENANQRAVNLSMGVSVIPGYDQGEVLAHCEELIKEYIYAARMGETLFISKIAKHLLDNAKIYNTKVSPYTTDVYPLTGDVFVPGVISVAYAI